MFLIWGGGCYHSNHRLQPTQVQGAPSSPPDAPHNPWLPCQPFSSWGPLCQPPCPKSPLPRAFQPQLPLPSPQ